MYLPLGVSTPCREGVTGLTIEEVQPLLVKSEPNGRIGDEGDVGWHADSNCSTAQACVSKGDVAGWFHGVNSCRNGVWDWIEV